jgi:hypothetical protein
MLLLTTHNTTLQYSVLQDYTVPPFILVLHLFALVNQLERSLASYVAELKSSAAHSSYIHRACIAPRCLADLGIPYRVSPTTRVQIVRDCWKHLTIRTVGFDGIPASAMQGEMSSRQGSSHRLRSPLKGGTAATSLISEFLPATIPEEEPSDDRNPHSGSATWRHLFLFTRRHQAGLLSLAIVASLLVAAVKTVFAVLIGRIMDIVSPLGAGSINGSTAMAGLTIWCVVLAGLGLASWAFNSALLALWIVSGELVARTARRSVFRHLVEREMAWFDGHNEGLSSALSGMQA